MEAYSARYEAALALAARAHHAQLRKGSDLPYFIHPVHVSVILLRHRFADDVAIAGLLHDVVEDQEFPLAQIEAEFGPAVAEMVGAVTEQKHQDGQLRPWEIRKQEALDKARRASPEAVALKAADALHNVHTLTVALRREGPAVWGVFRRGSGPTLRYYQSVAALARERWGAHPLVDELDAALQELERAIAAGEGR